MTAELHSVEELKKYIIKNIISQLAPKTVVLLEGEMGVGKTQLVKLFCEQFQCDKEVSSPTFAIIQEYVSSLGLIHHVDLYRVETQEELENTGFWEIFNKSQGIIFIEWPQKMDASRIPKDWKRLNVQLCFAGNESRKINLT